MISFHSLGRYFAYRPSHCLGHFSALLTLLLLAVAFPAAANNVQVTNVQLGSRNTSNDTRSITFNLTWENSWNQSYGRDAVWIFVKYRKSGTATWHHAFLGDTGSHSDGDCANCVVAAGYRDPSAAFHKTNNPTVGVYLHDGASNRNMTTVSSNNVSLLWNYAENSEKPLGDNDEVEIRVYAIEMVYVPGGGDFIVGDGGASSKSFRNAKDGSPYDVTFAGNGYDMVDTFSGITHLATQVAETVGTSKGSTLSLNYQLPAGENRATLVSFMSKDKDPNSIVIGGTTPSLVQSISTGSKTTLFIYLFYPNASHHGQNLTVTFGSTSNGVILTASTFGGVNQTTAVDTSFSTMITASSVSQAGIPWERADVIYSAVCTEKAAVTVPSPQIELYDSPAVVSTLFGATSILEPSQTPTEKTSYTLASGKELSMISLVLKPEPQSGGASASGSTGLGNNAYFPTGYDPFYCMKYEVTQAQYTSFLNTLTLAQQAERTSSSPESPPGTGALEANNDYRNGIDVMQSGGTFPAIYACNLDGDGTYNEDEGDGMPLACNYLGWEDLAAWLDWAALRPMSELEFEKACRGIGNIAYKHPWGNSQSNFTAGNSFTNMGTTSEELLLGSDAANANAGNAFQGPARVGVFARPTNAKFSGRTTRYYSGASRLGILELAGNLWEQVVTVETQQGRDFAGNHGDGSLSTLEWPELAPSTGTGSRGGGWDSTNSNELHVSDRSKANFTPATRHAAYGGRGVRSEN